MARSLRIEKANGVYHVINRGNYRQDLFINEGAHFAFERCLFETCEKCGWVLEGYCAMANHPKFRSRAAGIRSQSLTISNLGKIERSPFRRNPEIRYQLAINTDT